MFNTKHVSPAALRLHRALTAGAQLGKHSFLLWLSVWTGNKEADQTPAQKATAAPSWNGVAGLSKCFEWVEITCHI